MAVVLIKLQDDGVVCATSVVYLDKVFSCRNDWAIEGERQGRDLTRAAPSIVPRQELQVLTKVSAWCLLKAQQLCLVTVRCFSVPESLVLFRVF